MAEEVSPLLRDSIASAPPPLYESLGARSAYGEAGGLSVNEYQECLLLCHK